MRNFPGAICEQATPASRARCKIAASSTSLKTTATVAGNGQELELLSGTPLPRAGNKAAVQGALGADRKVSLRWQTKVTEQVRRVLLTAQTAAAIHLNPKSAEVSVSGLGAEIPFLLGDVIAP